jgi:hypothetical protein
MQAGDRADCPMALGGAVENMFVDQFAGSGGFAHVFQLFRVFRGQKISKILRHEKHE